MGYIIEALPTNEMSYENVVYWSQDTEVLDTFIQFNNTAPPTRARVRYHPKVPSGVLWMGYFQRWYSNIKIGQEVEVQFAGAIPIIKNIRFVYRYLKKAIGEGTYIDPVYLKNYILSKGIIEDTYVERNQGLVINTPFLDEKTLIIIAQEMDVPTGGVIKLGRTQISFESATITQTSNAEQDSDPSAP